MNKFLPTNPAPLLYKGAPLTTQDLIMQQVRFEEAFLPHVIYDPQEPAVMRKEILVNQKKDPIKRNWLSANIHRVIA